MSTSFKSYTFSFEVTGDNCLHMHKNEEIRKQSVSAAMSSSMPDLVCFYWRI